MVVLEGRVCRAFALRRRLRRMRSFSVKVLGVREDRGQGTLAYSYGQTVCAVYDCCVNGKRQKNCGACDRLPCEKFTKDPTVSDEQNAAHLAEMMERLRGK